MMIQKYLDSLLNEGLEEVRFRFRQRIAEDIKNRLCSLLARWEEEEYRETILFTTKEEALFYEPYAEKGTENWWLQELETVCWKLQPV